MTVDDPAHAARWCARLAEVLADVGRRTAQLAEAVGRDWSDGHGREWADRTARIGSRLEREAEAAGELGGAYARQPDEAAVPPSVPGRTSSRTGARLGGTEAERVEDERGMRLAELDPPPPG